MPYITFSKGSSKRLSGSELCDGVSELFEDSLVERRGVRTLQKVVDDASNKGFSKAVVIGDFGKSGKVRADVIMLKGHRGDYSWGGAYLVSLARSGTLSVKSLSGGSNGAKKRFISEAGE